MAVVKNVSADARSIHSAGAPSLYSGDEATVPDARFAGRAWPKSTWELIEPPSGDFVDESTEDAYLFTPKPVPEVPAESKPTRGGKAA